MNAQMLSRNYQGRRHFIGGSDARIIMGPDEAALIRLWKEKRGEGAPEDLSDGAPGRPARSRWCKSTTMKE